ncbi:MAG: response regulator [Candidatus Omnitrophica bacterium]|nr:response regulator [Candidatus Omnitrophota bacterium]MBU4590155.1 response regulator [Candidatus Omnitrophota bacterium]
MAGEALKVLMIEFDKQNILKIRDVLSSPSDISYDVSWAQKEENVLSMVDKEDFDVILISYKLLGANGLEILSDLQYKDLKGPVIMMADKGDEEFSTQAMRLGAHDFVIRGKGFEKGLPLVIHNALNAFRAKKERERLQKEIAAKNIELESANRKLKEIDRIKSDFVANVAHEFRTPLTIIKGNTDMVIKGGLGKVTDQQKDMLDGAVKIANRLSRLVNDLLDISKIESGKLKLKKETINMNRIIEENMAAFDKIIKDKKQTLQKELAKDMPDITADMDKITQVFINLLSNAVKYSAEGGSVIVKTTNLEKEIMVEVADTGEGIAPEDIDKVFDKFTRVTAEKKEGTGLGLPIAKDIVVLHKGRMWVKSELGKGSQFFFTLPK